MKKLVITFTISMPLAVLEKEGVSEAEARAQFATLADGLREDAPDGSSITMHSDILEEQP